MEKSEEGGGGWRKTEGEGGKKWIEWFWQVVKGGLSQTPYVESNLKNGYPNEKE